jgi:hypothetical protein
MDKDKAHTRMATALDRLRVDDIDGGVALYVALWDDVARSPIEDVYLFKYPDVVRIVAALSAHTDALGAAFAALATPLPSTDDVASHHNWLCVRAMAHDDAAMVAWFDQSSRALRENRYLVSLLDAEVAPALARKERWLDAGGLVLPAERLTAYRTLANAIAQPYVRAQSPRIATHFRAQTREVGMMLAAGEHVAALNELCDLAIANDRSDEMTAIVAKLREFYYSL